MTRIALDVMGGDFAPAATVAGAVEAMRAHDLRPVLVGDKQRIAEELAKLHVGTEEFEIVAAPSVVEMNEQPASALRQKRDSSIIVAAELLKEGRAEALISVGNTGATMAAGVLVIGRSEGVIRPAMAGLLPSNTGRVLLLDIGANADCTPAELVQFAIMGSIYARRIVGVDDPRVGLLNVGEEPVKGSRLYRDAHELLDGSPVNFVGNLEGVDLFSGEFDVVVCDGFTGNVAIKLMEGVGDFALGRIRQDVRSSPLAILGAFLMRPTLRSLKRTFDYAEWGGAPLLGVNGLVLIGHGRSDARAVANGVRAAQAALDVGLVEEMAAGLKAAAETA